MELASNFRQLRREICLMDADRNSSNGRCIPYNWGYIGSLAAANPMTWIMGEARGSMYVTFEGGNKWSGVKVSHPGGGAGVGEGWRYVGSTTHSEAVAVPWNLNGSALAFSYNGSKTWTSLLFASGR